LSMSAIDDEEGKSSGQESDHPTSQPVQPQKRRSSSFGNDLRSRLLTGLSGIPSNLSMSALDSDDEESVGSTTVTSVTPRTGVTSTADTVLPPTLTPGTSGTNPENRESVPVPTSGKSHVQPALSTTTSAGTGNLQHGADLAAQLHANPKLAALRTPGGLAMTPLNTASRVVDKSSISPPILMNPKCSGYFVEPVGRNVFALSHGLNFVR
jgi:dual specificity phosphatase 12